MIKYLQADKLKVGMYIHDLGADWSTHPFVRSRFLLGSDADIDTIQRCGIRHVYIDTDRGLDVSDAQPEAERTAELHAEMMAIAAEPILIPRAELQEEVGRAKRLRHQATQAVRTVMQDVRLGKAVQLGDVEPLITAMAESVLRNPGALISLAQIKDKDQYTFQHSVSVGTLMIAFAHSLGMTQTQIHQAGLGGLLHDAGKALVPDEILNKPGRLTEAEFDIIKLHPSDGHAFLQRSEGIGAIPLDITLHHHERIDGTGYPHGLKGDDISLKARMAAIVDVYDAITADRCYHRGIAPTDALRKIFEWSKTHLDPELVKAFMRCIGIYPVGTLVRLESGRLGIVTEHNPDSLLQPRLKIIYDTRKQGYVSPYQVDLSRSMGRGGADAIASHESADKWGIDPGRFL
ncbi:HD-GYP domain-containing protein [Chitinimonas sp. BJYL2]|uniref:HD-GYP domain-containing protein n=1 Tax=Chitinimonas sp. BJYL2 TaxID=2976696 RepID=UPI0022B57476|nr:HD-GYP domain-containing protein [Chitinimonas sp. BJYL2]